MGQLIRLEEKHRQSVCEYLNTSPLENLKLISIINHSSLGRDRQFYGYREKDGWQGIIYFDWDITVFSTSDRAAALLARAALEREPFIPLVTGMKETVSVFRETFKKAAKKIKSEKNLTVHLLEEKNFDFSGDYLALKIGGKSDAGEITRLTAAMNLEESGFDLLSDKALGYPEIIKQRIENGNYFILNEEGIIKFIAMISFVTPFAAQFDEVYVLPQFRGKGYARRCLGYLCQYIFSEIAPRVCASAYQDNPVPFRYYKKLGFKPVLELQSIYLEAD
jgi:ribosomal protein S18 acetylase RimI-like enzyme